MSKKRSLAAEARREAERVARLISYHMDRLYEEWCEAGLDPEVARQRLEDFGHTPYSGMADGDHE